ncbi:MAG: hypothetical protein D3925_05135 [Candidatus Electrothrix sp. AR5]|nr:hypothetical protein [Candidatus Electrothrix sp. AR5]
MLAYRQKIYAFERAIRVIEESYQKDPISAAASERSNLVLNNTYLKLIEIFPVSDWSGAKDHELLPL